MQRVTAEKYFSLFKGYFMREMAFFFSRFKHGEAGGEGTSAAGRAAEIGLRRIFLFFFLPLFSKRRILSRPRNILCYYKEAL